MLTDWFPVNSAENLIMILDLLLNLFYLLGAVADIF